MSDEIVVPHPGTYRLIPHTEAAPPAPVIDETPIHGLKPWRIPKKGVWTGDMNPSAGRRWRSSDPPRANFCVLHSTESDVHNPAGYLRWAKRQRERYSGYPIVISLDHEDPLLLGHHKDFKFFHGGPWNRGWGIGIVGKVSQFGKLTSADLDHLAGNTVRALAAIGCLPAGRHPVNREYVSDRNLLSAPHQGDVQEPVIKRKNQWVVGGHVAHDWCVSDRNKDGKITSSDDWKSDPGEFLVSRIRALRESLRA